MSKMPSNGDPKNTPWYVNREGVNLFKFLGIYASLIVAIVLILAIFSYAPLAIPIVILGIVLGMLAYDLAKAWRGRRGS